jgi:hypothetical protein
MPAHAQHHDLLTEMATLEQFLQRSKLLHPSIIAVFAPELFASPLELGPWCFFPPLAKLRTEGWTDANEELFGTTAWVSSRRSPMVLGEGSVLCPVGVAATKL